MAFGSTLFTAVLTRRFLVACPKERKAIYDVLVSEILLFKYKQLNQTGNICQMLCGYGIEQSKRLQAVTTDPTLCRGLAALNKHQESLIPTLRKCCSMKNIDVTLNGNLKAFTENYQKNC